jgi:hypothetical protein
MNRTKEATKTDVGSMPAGIIDDDFPGDRILAKRDEFDAGDAMVGQESVRAEDLGQAFLYVLQAQSKTCNEGQPEFVPGARPGMLLNNASRKLYDGKAGIDLVAAYFRKVFNEWIPVDDGGGFVGTWDPDEQLIIDLRNAQGQFNTLKVQGGTERFGAGRDTEIVETNEMYAIVGSPGFGLDRAERVIIPFTSIKQKAFKRGWLSTWQNIRYNNNKIGIHWCRWRMTTVFETKWKPNGAWNVAITLAGGQDDPVKSFMRASDPVRMEALEFAKAASAGAVRADYAVAERTIDEEEIPL